MCVVFGPPWRGGGRGGGKNRWGRLLPSTPMSSAALRVAALKKRAAAAVPASDAEADEAGDTLGELPGRGPLRPPEPRGMVPPARAPAAYAPATSDDCFATALEVEIGGEAGAAPAAVRAYFTPPCTAGADGDLSQSTVLVCHHGAGFGALSFALLAREVTQRTNGELGVLAYDCRGHGRSVFPEPAARTFSLEVLTADLLAVLGTLFPERAKRPTLLLAGHSMGGAVVVAGAHAIHAQSFARVSGVAMLDIVEGTSLQLLPRMHDIVRRRPAGFVSVEAAIQWHVETRTVRNVESARRSVPSLVRRAPPGAMFAWCWRANLVATEPFWRSWFTHLSTQFLAVRAARLLILSETDHLDQTLMIGQMQGKYQLSIVRDAGHCVQEVGAGSSSRAGPAAGDRAHPGAVLEAQRKVCGAASPREEGGPAVGQLCVPPHAR